MAENKANGFLVIDGYRNTVFIPKTDTVFAQALTECLKKHKATENINGNILQSTVKKFLNGELDNDGDGNN